MKYKFKYLKQFENHNTDIERVITIKISTQTMEKAFYDVYYPTVISSTNEEAMTKEDYIEMVLDITQGEVSYNLEKNDIKVIRISGGVRRQTIDVDNLSLDIIINSDKDKKVIISIIEKFLKSDFLSFIDNEDYQLDGIYVDYDIYVNGEEDIDYSKLNQSQLQSLIDDALDSGDYSIIDELRPFLEKVKNK